MSRLARRAACGFRRAFSRAFELFDCGLAPEPSPVRDGKAAPPPPKPPQAGVPSSVLCERGGTEARIDGTLKGPKWPAYVVDVVDGELVYAARKRVPDLRILR